MSLVSYLVACSLRWAIASLCHCSRRSDRTISALSSARLSRSRGLVCVAAYLVGGGDGVSVWVNFSMTTGGGSCGVGSWMGCGCGEATSIGWTDSVIVHASIVWIESVGVLASIVWIESVSVLASTVATF